MMTAKRKWTHSLFALALLALFVSAGTLLADKGGKKKPPKDDPPPPEITISYSIKLLGTLGGSSSEAWGMNEWGDVVGKSQTEAGPYAPWAPFVHFSGTPGMTDLRDLLTQADRDLWEWEYFLPVSINSGIDEFNGGWTQICGSAWLLDGSGTRLQRYSIRISLFAGENDTAVIDIVSPNEAVSVSTGGLNEFGDVAGAWRDSEGIQRTFVYADDPTRGTTDIGDLGGDYTTAWAINNNGEVTGLSKNADGGVRAYLYVPGAGLRDLGIIKETRRKYAGGYYSYGFALNDHGTVVGLSVAGAKNQRTVVHAFCEAGNGMKDLGTLDGHNESEADGINSHGEIVGESYNRGNPGRAFFYSSAFGMLELDALIDNLPVGYRSMIHQSRFQINDSGTISGSIFLEDFSVQAFVLTPNP